jgi:tetratricopeptide (TPR) repeat protein
VKKWLEKVLLGTGTYAELMNRFEKNPNDIEVATELGKKYEDKFERDKALEFYREALKAHASGAEGFTSYGLVKIPCAEFAEYSVANLTMFAQGQESPSAMQEFIERCPKSPLLHQAYFELSKYFRRYGSKEDAEKFFEEYLSRFPDDPRAYRLYAKRIIQDGGNAEKGAALMEKAIELNRLQILIASQHIGFIIADYAKLQALKGDNEGASEVFDEEFLKTLGRVFTQELFYFANFWLDQNILRNEAEKYAELSLSVAPERSSNLRSMAEIYIRLNKMEKAIGIYGPDFARQNWDNAVELQGYANFYARKELNMKSTLEAARRSVELEPNVYDYVCWATLSHVLLKLKNYKEALQAAEKAVELAPSFISSIYKTQVEQIKKLMKKRLRLTGL